MSFALLCPGQGAQRPGFLTPVLDLPETAALRTALQNALQLSPAQVEALSQAQLQKNAIAQPVVAAFQLAQWVRLGSALPKPKLVVGYSLGALVALACAGVITPEATIALAARRAVLMDAACAAPSGLVALRGLHEAAVEALVARHGVHIAIRNGEDRFVIGGLRAGLAAAEAEALTRGASLTPLGVTTPSHTPLLVGAVAPFQATVRAFLSGAPAFPVLSALNALPLRQPDTMVDNLAREIAAPLDWMACLDVLAEHGINVCLELGPGGDLSRMLRERHPHIAARSVDEFRSQQAMVGWVEAHL